MDAEKGRWILIILGMIINHCLGSVCAWSGFVGPLTAYFTKTLSQSVTANEILLPFGLPRILCHCHAVHRQVH